MCECFICSPAVVMIALFFPGWLQGILSKRGSQLWCRIEREKRGGEAHGHSVLNGCTRNLECGVGRSDSPVQCGTAGLARCQPGHCAHEEAVCGQH